jgi:hypothetical protein
MPVEAIPHIFYFQKHKNLFVGGRPPASTVYISLNACEHAGYTDAQAFSKNPQCTPATPHHTRLHYQWQPNHWSPRV